MFDVVFILRWAGTDPDKETRINLFKLKPLGFSHKRLWPVLRPAQVGSVWRRRAYTQCPSECSAPVAALLPMWCHLDYFQSALGRTASVPERFPFAFPIPSGKPSGELVWEIFWIEEAKPYRKLSFSSISLVSCSHLSFMHRERQDEA